MHPKWIPRNNGHPSAAVNNSDNKDPAKTGQRRLTFALVCAQNEISVRAMLLRSIK
jgi:hypothetical protein